MDTTSPLNNAPPQGCPMHGKIRNFRDIQIIPGLIQHVKGKALDGGRDWGEICLAIHTHIFHIPDFFSLLLQSESGSERSMLHRIIAKERTERAHEALFILFDGNMGIRNYAGLLKVYQKVEIYDDTTRLNQLVSIGITNFKRFLLPRVFEMIDAGQSWGQIENCFINSHEILTFLGMSDIVNEAVIKTGETVPTSLNAGMDKISLCPMDRHALEKHLRKDLPRPFTGCMLLGTPGVRGKTLMHDFLILCAMAVYQFEKLEQSLKRQPV